MWIWNYIIIIVNPNLVTILFQDQRFKQFKFDDVIRTSRIGEYFMMSADQRNWKLEYNGSSGHNCTCPMKRRFKINIVLHYDFALRFCS